MDMSMTSMDMASTTMSMAMATSTSMSGMDMDMGSDMSMNTTMMGMSQMAMTFFVSTATPLFSMAWTPSSTGIYAGTCIFLIAFAAIFRALLAIRTNFYDILTIVRNRHVRREGGYLREIKPTTRRWRANEAVMLASLDVVLAAVGYLLMIAVMTMNVGYFLSVLAGVFVGSIIFSHLMAQSAAH